MEERIFNAVIIGSKLGFQDGCLVAQICFKEGMFSGQCTDAIILDTDTIILDDFRLVTQRRIGTAAGMGYIIKILETLEVDKWEDLKGVFIRIHKKISFESYLGYNFKVNRKVVDIGNSLKDKWLNIEKCAMNGGKIEWKDD